MTRRRGYWLAAWALVTLFVLLAFREVAWTDALAAYARADPLRLALAVLANAAILPLGALQWSVFLARERRPGFGTMLWITAVTSTVSNGGPFLAGHAAGIHLLATRGGTGHATALSVKALDQLAEGIAKLVMVGCVVLLVPLPPTMRAAALTLVVVVPALAVGLLLAAWRSHTLERWAAGASGWRARTLDFLAETARQLAMLRRPGRFGIGVLLALLMKATELAAITCVLAALSVQIPFWGVLLALTAVNLSTMASVTPANLGIYEGSALLAYHLAGLAPDVALGVAVLQHLAYLTPLAGAGWVLLARSGLRPREAVKPADRA